MAHLRKDHIIVRTAFVSTYPPRRCGIATFANDLTAASSGREVVALVNPERGSPYPLEVHHRIRHDERPDYLRTARDLTRCVDVVSVQHEYGIWGGKDGEYVLDFVRELQVPAVATLHTVLRSPTENQRAVLKDLIRLVDATVVMSDSAADLLRSAYGVRSRIDVIPHGVPDVPLMDPATIKPTLGMEGRDIILTFGLLGPGKGYELAIDALPAVVAKNPNACFVIVGATHPDLIRREGEAYRDSLVARAKALGMTGHIKFVDQFVSRVDLIRWLEAADVFVTPYPNMDQIVSGTLSYAMGAGRAIVSTPYSYAEEQLAGGRGILVAPGSSDRFAAALNAVLGDDQLRASLGQKAYDHSRKMVWSEVGASYRRLFERVATDIRVPAAAAAAARPLEAVNA